MLIDNIYYNKNSKVILNKEQNRYVCFRKSFVISENVSAAEIKVFATTKFVMYINGKFVSRGLFLNDNNLQQFNLLKIKEYLKNGVNAITFICAPAYNTSQMLFAEADITLNNGEKICVYADKTFKTKVLNSYIPGDRISPSEMVEMFDNREFDNNLFDDEFDDSKWEYATEKLLTKTSVVKIAKRNISVKEIQTKARAIVSAGSGNECEDDIPLLEKVKKEVNSVKIGTLYVIGTECEVKPLDKGFFSYLFVDVEKIVKGFVKIDVSGYNSDVIDICYAKELKDGFPVIENVSRFVLKDGENELETRFSQNTFRYLFIIFRNYVRADKLINVSVKLREADIKIPEKIKQDEKLFTQTKLLLNRVDEYLFGYNNYEDLQSGIRIAKAISALSKNNDYYEQLILSFLNEQNADGLVPEYIPYYEKTYNAEDILDLIYSVYDLYKRENNKEFLVALYNKILLVFNWFMKFEDKKGLLKSVKYNDDNEYDCILNLKYYRALSALKDISLAISEKENSILFFNKAFKLRRKIIKKFYSKDLKCFITFINGDEICQYVSKNVNALAANVLFDKKSNRAKAILNTVFGENDFEDIHELSSYYLSEYKTALQKQSSDNNDYDGRNDFIAVCSKLENNQEER